MFLFSDISTGSTRNIVKTPWSVMDIFDSPDDKLYVFEELVNNCLDILDGASAKALELGNGPALNSVIGLAPYVSSIVFVRLRRSRSRRSEAISCDQCCYGEITHQKPSTGVHSSQPLQVETKDSQKNFLLNRVKKKSEVKSMRRYVLHPILYRVI